MKPRRDRDRMALAPTLGVVAVATRGEHPNLHRRRPAEDTAALYKLTGAPNIQPLGRVKE